jgi:N-acetylneuraminate synthase
MDLATIPHMTSLWNVPVGLSDHTLGIASSVVAVTLGACMIERHLTGSRGEPGPDSAFSLEPDEFRAMVSAVREAEVAVGGVRYGPTDDERKSLPFRRSIFVVAPIRAGEPFTPQNVRVIRPADGLPPRDLNRVLGRRAVSDVDAGTPLSWDLVGE